MVLVKFGYLFSCREVPTLLLSLVSCLAVASARPNVQLVKLHALLSEMAAKFPGLSFTELG